MTADIFMTYSKYL